MRIGFSLVELSIVLVILGLLTGGILGGQSLIRAAELRAVSTEFQRYQAAAFAFRDKYFMIPGDLSSATRFWNRMYTDAACITNSGATQGSPGACDGNGDGAISTGFGGSLNINESFLVWQHLAAAGMIEGSYSGQFSSTLWVCEITNCPRSKLASDAFWGLNYRTSPWDSTNTVHQWTLGKNILSGNVYPSDGPGILTPEETWNIDTKLDDGKAGTGGVRARQTGGFCYTGSGAAAVYNLTLSSKICYLEFITRL
jgi:prepilin-type N-terminal cleavage/methylation domain-containing protein